MMPYGPQPRVEMMVKVAGHFGCRITPTVADAIKEHIPAGLITYYDPPLLIEPREIHQRPYDWLVISVDPPHLQQVERTLRFRPYTHG